MSDTFGTLKKLHKQPREVRQQIGFFIAGFVTVVIFVFWLATLDTRFDDIGVEENDPQRIASTPFETVAQSFHGMVTAVKEQFSGLRNE